MDLLTALQFITLLLITLSASCAVGHALELPGKMKLTRDVYLAVQPIYYPGFTLVGGIAEVVAVPMLIVLSFLTPPDSPAFAFTVAALVAQVATQLIFWIATQPVNRAWLANSKLSRAGSAFFGTDRGDEPGRDWTGLRNRWEYSHVARAVAGIAALMLLALALDRQPNVSGAGDMKQSAGSVREPEDWPRVFTERLKAGRLEDILAMYHPEARMLAPPSGELVAGHESIRAVLAGLIRSQGQLESHVVRHEIIGDVAVLYTDFNGSAVGASGETQEVRQHAIEILQRQPDGTWKLIFGDPSARESQASPP